MLHDVWEPDLGGATDDDVTTVSAVNRVMKLA